MFYLKCLFWRLWKSWNSSVFKIKFETFFHKTVCILNIRSKNRVFNRPKLLFIFSNQRDSFFRSGNCSWYLLLPFLDLDFNIILFDNLNSFPFISQSLILFILILIFCNWKFPINSKEIFDLPRRNHSSKDESWRILRIYVHKILFVIFNRQVKIDLRILI